MVTQILFQKCLILTYSRALFIFLAEAVPWSQRRRQDFTSR